MPRQSRSRPAARPAAPRPAAPAQTRSASTAAAPYAGSAAPHAHHAPPVPPQAQTQSREPGMLAQMAATAGSVAVGSTVGHGISHMLFGGSSSAPAPVEAQAPPVQQQQSYQSQGISCDVQAKEFTKCLEKADLPSCTWYLEQLKACQAAAAPY
ncbi:Mitochondrial intermembrane space cysteine motif-containing protein [Sparassis crispa]|uniref:Mitochondrial intermembrane space cysteine motif-containing protein n=1 Tax=Sparassis crispa TaxID=139825 RepID=A0A401GNR0_9APHY|nr:Mitochondrial intermembrane space cysteine motif-containing protein [Sparassis crispa]GBE83881.1 Mitochondrial intermembrane space cysteine motif-containing protein [Sparassis crispa]